MKKIKEKEITKLEILESINRSFSRIEKKMATKKDIEKLAISTANSFFSLEKRLDTDFGLIRNDIAGIKNQLSGTNKRIDDISLNRVKYEDFDKLKKRVEILEKV